MADMNAESIQQRIQIARRDAEALKDRIKRKKDELADTTRKYQSRYRYSQFFPSSLKVIVKLTLAQFAKSPDNGSTSYRD
jgi:guanine nucleotide-binding protein G(I)/G(S)/G(T) subunit beta-1